MVLFDPFESVSLNGSIGLLDCPKTAETAVKTSP